MALAPSAAFAQTDISGGWAPRFSEDQPERIPGPELGDYLGLPITDGARQWALSWDPSRLTLPEHQCQVHVSPYIYRGPLHLRIWEERDPETQQLIAIKNYISTYEQTRTIWMDGRPHPPEYAAHTWRDSRPAVGKATCSPSTTTHIKQGWVRRNGLPESDRATLTEHFIRHGNILTHISSCTDPVYLTEPLIKTENFVAERAHAVQCRRVAVAVHSRGRDRRPAAGRGAALPARQELRVKEFLDRHQLPHRGRDGRRQDDVSGVPVGAREAHEEVDLHVRSSSYHAFSDNRRPRVPGRSASPRSPFGRPAAVVGAADDGADHVTGPVPLTGALRDAARDYPFNASTLDLAKQGYVEEEFFIQGVARGYDIPREQTSNASAAPATHPYKTRIVVRRPAAANKFNGTAIVEWTNVSEGFDNEVDWFHSAEHLMSAGYAWVGVSAQNVGVSALKQWSPTATRRSTSPTAGR